MALATAGGLGTAGWCATGGARRRLDEFAEPGENGRVLGRAFTSAQTARPRPKNGHGEKTPGE